MANFDEWQKAPDGLVLLSRSIEFRIVAMDSGMVALRVTHTPTKTLFDAVQAGTAEPEVLQVIMNNGTARELAKTLQAAAKEGTN
jgi:hypothetical protein